MEFPEIVADIANLLKEFDSEKPIHKDFQPGIGPFGEPQLIKEISNRLNRNNIKYQTNCNQQSAIYNHKSWILNYISAFA